MYLSRTLAFPKLKIDWMLVAAFSLAIPVIAMTSVVHGRLPGTHDAYLHLMRLINATLNLKTGNLIPRWGPHLHFGFGYPLGNFYAPGWHIAGAMLVTTGVPAVWVWLMFQSAGILLYPVGGYLFAKLFTDRAGALLGAAVCLFAPLRFYEIFVQGNVSQLIAMGLIPWVLWAFARCALSPSFRRMVVASLILGALIITHHPTAAFMIPFTGLYAIFVGLVSPNTGKRKRQIVSVLVAYGLALVVSATYWLPALTEVQYVNVQAAADQFQLQNNFVPLNDLLGPVRPPDRGSLNIPFTLSIGQLSLAAAVIGGLLALVPRLRASTWQRAHIIGGIVVLLVGLYAMTYPSLWLWQTVPKASLILFPWRLLGLITVALIPGSIFLVESFPRKWRAAFVGLLVAGLFCLSLPLLFPIYPDVAVPEPVTPATSINYEIASGNLGGVSNNEYLPSWATQRPDFSACTSCYDGWGWQIFANSDSQPAGVTVNTASATRPRSSAFNVTSSDAFRFELHQMYFPGWAATLDGQPVNLVITQPFGLMAIDVPSGSHQVEVWYEGTAIQHLADGASVLGIVVCLVFLLLQIRVPPALKSISDSPAYHRLGKTVSVGMLVSAVAVAGIVQPYTDLFRTQGTVTAPEGMEHPAGAVFTNSSGESVMKLIGYTLSQDNAAYGEWVDVKLYWQALEPISEAWSIKIALADPDSQVDWTASDHADPGGFSTQQWPMDKYVIDENVLRIGSDVPPYIGDLIVQVYAADGEQLLANGSNRLQLGNIRIAEDGQADLRAGVNAVDVTFGDWLLLRATDLTKTGNTWHLDLFWEVLRAPAKDYILMIHMVNEGQDVSTADQPPIPSYATQYWQEGQYLETSIDLTVPPTADSLLLGLYDPTTIIRLPVTIDKGDLQSANQGILLPLSETMP